MYANVNFYVWNSATCSCENNEYLPSSIIDTVIRCDEIVNSLSANGSANIMSTVLAYFP